MTRRQTIAQRRALERYEHCQRAYAATSGRRKLLWWHKMRDAMTELLRAAQC